jgi:hypothetical protein
MALSHNGALSSLENGSSLKGLDHEIESKQVGKKDSLYFSIGTSGFLQFENNLLMNSVPLKR